MSNAFIASSDLIHVVRPVAARIESRDRALSRRLRTACDDAAEHAEAAMLSTGRVFRTEIKALRSSLKDAEACLAAAVSVGHVSAQDTALARELAIRALALTHVELPLRLAS